MQQIVSSTEFRGARFSNCRLQKCAFNKYNLNQTQFAITIKTLIARTSYTKSVELSSDVRGHWC